MKRSPISLPFILLALCVLLVQCQSDNINTALNKTTPQLLTFDAANETDLYSRKEVIYGRTYGTALTMEVFTPKSGANGRGIVFFVSEGWYSDRSKIEGNIALYIEPLIKSGYTVFAVVHGSNPKFSLQENVEHAQRAVRFIRFHAARFGIDGQRLGATGDSAGGHLSLLVGSLNPIIDEATADSVERMSSQVQAVVAFFPPTDFLNWGQTGHHMLGRHPKVPLLGAFQFQKLDASTNVLELIKDSSQILTIAKSLSPIYQVNERSAPTLIIYGDQDSYIPTQQSEAFAAKLKGFHVPCHVIVEKGGEHDATTIKNNFGEALLWMDKYLK
jgi:acetyl esterase/lipase